MGVQGCRRPPTDFEDLQMMRGCPCTSTKVESDIVNTVGSEDNEIFMPMLREGAYVLLERGDVGLEE